MFERQLKQQQDASQRQEKLLRNEIYRLKRHKWVKENAYSHRKSTKIRLSRGGSNVCNRHSNKSDPTNPNNIAININNV
ncbi:unnamed protein product [Adineta ricciae]|uniref:Uncharacterized protein n=1 Tax=Adineta ricciae TaxID=249248 RepID=A0A816FRA6_ADIRI|nr:unnamed protein product [Adineta ricciae]CAF1665040.1 unnamed protein product [Adineta ricciae]